jgi:hypothetical protein
VVRGFEAGGGFFTPIGRQVPSSRYTSPRACASLRKSLTQMTILRALRLLLSARTSPLGFAPRVTAR